MISQVSMSYSCELEGNNVVPDGSLATTLKAGVLTQVGGLSSQHQTRSWLGDTLIASPTPTGCIVSLYLYSNIFLGLGHLW